MTDVNKMLVEALNGVMPYVVTQEVACHGLKCRESVCSSCSFDWEDAVAKAKKAYSAANEALAAAESQPTGCGACDDGCKDRGSCRLGDESPQVTPSVHTDTEMLDWLEDQVLAAGMRGVSFDYVRHVEDGIVTEKGFRFMRRGLLCDRRKTLREAIAFAAGKAPQ